jgi:hypothetical protein
MTNSQSLLDLACDQIGITSDTAIIVAIGIGTVVIGWDYIRSIISGSRWGN